MGDNTKVNRSDYTDKADAVGEGGGPPEREAAPWVGAGKGGIEWGHKKR